jgi:hypothetical protein
VSSQPNVPPSQKLKHLWPVEDRIEAARLKRAREEEAVNRARYELERKKAEEEEKQSGVVVEPPPPSPLEWAYLYRRIEDRPFSLAFDPKRSRGYAPLEAIYQDPHHNIAIEKPAQRGLSEWAITLALHMLDVGARYFDTDKKGLNVGYVFSSLQELQKFSKERLSGLMDESEHLSNLFTEFNSTFFKKAGPSYLYCAGGKSTKGMKSFAADKLILDEYDEIDPTVAALADARLLNSDLKLKCALSTPTLPDVGIDELYNQSDQRVWEVQCEHCREYNELDFWRDVCADGEHYEVWKKWDEETLSVAHMHVACPSCHEAINTFGPGLWTARRPEITRLRGYRIPALSCGKLDLNDLAQRAISTVPEKVEEFFRSFLGLPYEPKGARVTIEMLKRLSVELVNGLLPGGVQWTNTTMGVDVGYPRWRYRISSTGPGGFRYVRAMGYVVSDEGSATGKGKNGWQKLSDLLKAYKVRHCVVDYAPEYDACAAWAEKHKGIVLRASYPTTATALRGRLYRVPSEEPDDADSAEEQAANMVQVNRTMAMDVVYNNLAEGKEIWPAEFHNNREIVEHMRAPNRKTVRDKDGNLHPTWVHTKPDDYYHACVYDEIAQQTMPKSNFIGLLPVTGAEEE